MNRHRPTTRTAVALVVGAGLLAGFAPSTAFAATTTKTCQAASLAAIKSHAAAAVARRDATIDTMASKLAVRPAVTADHRSTLNALFAADKSGLAAANAVVQADTTCEGAHTDAQAIVTDFRVYLLLVPQTGLTTAADAGLSGAHALAASEPAIRLAIKVLPAGSTKDQAQALYDDLAAKVTTAQADFTGVGDAVLALTPSGYPANASTLATQTTRTANGGKALAAAASDASQLAALLGA